MVVSIGREEGEERRERYSQVGLSPHGVHISKTIHQNRPVAKFKIVLIVGWPKVPGFTVRWIKSNQGDSWMAKIFFTLSFTSQTICHVFLYDKDHLPF